MLILHPREVSFLGTPWKSVSAIAIDRTSTRIIADHDDTGPHVVFADCPEQRVTVRVTLDLAEDSFATPAVGMQGALEFATAPAGVHATRHRVSMQAVILSITHEVSLRKGAVRTIEFLGVSAVGGADPITITEIGGLS